MREARELLDTVAANVRARRSAAGLTLPELAARSGLGRSTLAQLESGQANPSIETLWAVAAALGVPFGQLIEAPTSAVRVLRRGDGVQVTSDGGTMATLLLGARAGRGAFELYRLDVPEGTSRRAQAHAPGTLEHVVVLAGRLRCGPEGATVELAPGDLASFPADVAHRYEPLRPRTRALLVMDYA